MFRGRFFLIFLLIFVSFLLVPFVTHNTFYIRIATEALMWIGLAITWDVLAGYTGYLNFGHGAFFGIGAYTTAILMSKIHMAFIPSALMGGVLAGVVALIVGFPTLRLYGAYFAIATWALGRAIQQLALVMNITGGPDGMRLPVFLNPSFFFYTMLILVGGIFLLLWFFLEKAPFGLKLKAIREDESGAMAIGINPSWMKVRALILSAIPAGLIGGVYAYWITYINPASVLGDIVTDQAVVMTLVGGLGTLIGPAIGAVLIYAFKTYFWAYLSQYQVLYLVILGAAIAVIVVFFPDGLWGTITSRQEGKKALKKGLTLKRKDMKDSGK